MATNQQFPLRSHVLHSWKEIATYTGRGVRTVQRYEVQYRFPVRRPAGGPRSAVMAFCNEIDQWLADTPKRPDAEAPVEKIFSTDRYADVDALCRKIRVARERSAVTHARVANTHQSLQNTKALCAKLNATWEQTMALQQHKGLNGNAAVKPTEGESANKSRSAATAV